MTTEPPSSIKSIARATRLLSTFTVSNPRLSLNELADSLGSAKATAHRYTVTLREAGLVRYSERDALFYLGPEMLSVAAAARAGMPIISMAAAHIYHLANELKRTVVMSVWDGDAPIIVSVEEQTEDLVQVGVRTGSRLQVESSAQGKIFCAFLDPETEPRVREALDSSPELRKQRSAIREAGLAKNSVALSGVRAVAAPVFHNGQVEAALGVVGTQVSIPWNNDSYISTRVREVAESIGGKVQP